MEVGGEEGGAVAPWFSREAVAVALGAHVRNRSGSQGDHVMALEARQITFALLNSPIIVYKIYIASL